MNLKKRDYEAKRKNDIKRYSLNAKYMRNSTSALCIEDDLNVKQ